MIEVKKEIESVLVMKDLHVEEASFSQSRPVTSKKVELAVRHSTSQLDDENRVEIKFGLRVTNETQDFEAKVNFLAIFEVDGDEQFKKAMFTENAVAIIFPFVRSYIVQLTAAPGMEPIVLPPLNIVSLLQDVDCENL